MDENKDEILQEEIAHDKVITSEVIIGTLAVIVVILAAVIAYLLLHKSGSPLPGSETASTTEQLSQAGSLDETNAYYEITAKYPAGVPQSDVMKKWEMDTIAQFKKDGNFANLTHDDIQMLGLDQRKMTLDITYKEARGDHNVSYIFTISSDMLGAHPNTTYKTFTFNSKTNEEMSLKDVFAPGEDYLSVLSQKSRALLPPIIAKNSGSSQQDINKDMLNDGTRPTLDSFAAWYVEGTDLVLIFAPYAVAPYAAGPQILRIPVVQLSGAKANTRVNDFGTIY